MVSALFKLLKSRNKQKNGEAAHLFMATRKISFKNTLSPRSSLARGLPFFKGHFELAYKLALRYAGLQ